MITGSGNHTNTFGNFLFQGLEEDFRIVLQ